MSVGECINDLLNPQVQFLAILSRHTQHLRNDLHRKWESELFDKIHVAFALHRINQLIRDLLNASSPLFYQTWCERKVDQRAQTGMIRRVTFEHTQAHEVGNRGGGGRALLDGEDTQAIFDKAL